MTWKVPFHLQILILFLLLLVLQMFIVSLAIIPELKKTDKLLGELLIKNNQWNVSEEWDLREESYDIRDSSQEPIYHFGDRTYILRGDRYYSYKNPLNLVRLRLQNLLMIVFFLMITGYLYLINRFNKMFLNPIVFLKHLVQNEIYNLKNLDDEEEEIEDNELKDLTRFVREILNELKQRNRTLLQQSRQFMTLSFTDGLTGLNNRAALNKRLQDKEQWLTPNSPISFLLMDIDFFKQYNDTYGHLMGDDVLKQVSQVFSEVFYSPNDFWARYGGEEFAVLLRNTSLTTAIKAGERLRRGIENLLIPHKKSAISEVLTCSIGVASTIPGIYFEVDHLLDTADEALYKSKETGRNKTSALNPVINYEEIQEL